VTAGRGQLAGHAGALCDEVLDDAEDGRGGRDGFEPDGFGHRAVEAPRQTDVNGGHAAGIGELKNALGPRVHRLVHRMTEARRLAARAAYLLRQIVNHRSGLLAGGNPGPRLD
jgi:hypothetical protein